MTSIMNLISRKNVLFLIAISVSIFYVVSGSKCTNVLKKKEVLEVVVKEPCIQKYTARCGWLSLSYCTFYHNTHCDKKVNETIEKYYVKTDCCKGFIMVRNGTCIEKKPGVIYYEIKPTQVSVSSADDPHYKEHQVEGQKTEKKVMMDISGGGYAGIACGLVLIITVAAFIFIAVQKRKKKKQQMKTDMANKVVYEAGSQPIVRNPGNSRTPSVYFSRSSREATPSSSRMVTPPTSPVKTSPPVEQPLISKTLEENDIPGPESNV